jgi:hypothetical protein
MLYQLLGAAPGGEDDDEEYEAGGPNVMQVDLSPDEVAAVERVS